MQCFLPFGGGGREADGGAGAGGRNGAELIDVVQGRSPPTAPHAV